MALRVRTGVNKWSLAPGSQGMINPPAIEETVHRLGELKRSYAWFARNPAEPEKCGLNTNDLQIVVELKNEAKYTVDFGPPHLQSNGAGRRAARGRTLGVCFSPGALPTGREAQIQSSRNLQDQNGMKIPAASQVRVDLREERGPVLMPSPAMNSALKRISSFVFIFAGLHASRRSEQEVVDGRRRPSLRGSVAKPGVFCATPSPARRRTRPAATSSRQGAAASCRPIGRPSFVNPQGTEIAGIPQTLKGRVLRSMISSCGRRWSGFALADRRSRAAGSEQWASAARPLHRIFSGWRDGWPASSRVARRTSSAEMFAPDLMRASVAGW